MLVCLFASSMAARYWTRREEVCFPVAASWLSAGLASPTRRSIPRVAKRTTSPAAAVAAAAANITN